MLGNLSIVRSGLVLPNVFQIVLSTWTPQHTKLPLPVESPKAAKGRSPKGVPRASQKESKEAPKEGVTKGVQIGVPKGVPKKYKREPQKESQKEPQT